MTINIVVHLNIIFIMRLNIIPSDFLVARRGSDYRSIDDKYDKLQCQQWCTSATDVVNSN